MVLGGQSQNDAVPAARDVAGDTVAVLRLFQRTRVRYFNLDHQTFGLVPDVGSALEHHWITEGVRHVGGGSQWHGMRGPWRFTAADRSAYREDPRFAYLDSALRLSRDELDEPRNEWSRRLLTALRTLSLATIMQPPAQQIVLQATALEALLGDEYVPDGSPPRGGQGHTLARRAAFLHCGLDDPARGRHGPSRPACAFMVAATHTQLMKGPEPVRFPRANGDPDPPPWAWFCSAYGYMRNLYDDRNAALHGARSRFDQQRASGYRFQLDDVIRAAVTWVLETGAPWIADLDDAITSLPRPSPIGAASVP